MLVIEKEKRRQMIMDVKRRFIEERCKRIHDPKWTFMGLDLPALEAQIKERKEREAKERERDEYLENKRLELYKKAGEIEKQQEESKKKAIKEINEFRITQQAPHTRASFDLNDPKNLKEPIPRSDDPCLSISSAQRFLGEDPNHAERKRVQISQFRSWLDQQIFERRAANMQNQFAEQQYQKINEEINKCFDDKEQFYQEMKSQIECDILKFNQELAAEAAKRRCEEEKDMKGEGGHIMYSCFLGPALTEDRGVPRSSTGWKTVVMDMYKGMTPEEKAKVREEQLQQIREHQDKREQEAKADAKWQAGYDQMFKTAYLKEQEECRKKAEMEQHIREQNRILAEEQKQRRLCENSMYKFQPTEEYYSKFGSSP